MKLLFFFFSMLFSFGYQDSIPDIVNDYIEQLREAIPEPIVIDTLNPDLSDNEYVEGYFNVSNLNMHGLKAFNVNITYALGIVPTHFVFTIDTFDLNSDYLFDVNFLNLSLLHLYGDGKTSMELTNLTIEGRLEIMLLPTTNLTIVGTQMHLDGAKFKIDGLLNDDDYSNRLSDLLSENVANIFNDQEHGLSLLVQDALNKAIADMISSTTLSESYDDLTGKNPGVVIQSVAELLFSVLNSASPETD